MLLQLREGGACVYRLLLFGLSFELSLSLIHLRSLICCFIVKKGFFFIFFSFSVVIAHVNCVVFVVVSAFLIIFPHIEILLVVADKARNKKSTATASRT